VPGDVNVPTGVIVVDRCGGDKGGLTVPAVTGMLTGGAVPGLDCPCVVTLAVGDTEAGAPAGMETAIDTGGKLAPGCTVAFVVHVTCWPATEHVQPSPVADVTVCPAGTANVSVVGPVVGPASASSLTAAW
jgi:hypothetical protein